MSHLTIYGDSIAAGYGAPPHRGFVPDLARLTSARIDKRVRYLNFGVPGMTSFQLASAFLYNEAWIGGLAHAATICVLIGGDDIIDAVPLLLSSRSPRTLQAAAKQSALAYHALLDRIRRHTRAPIVVGTIYNPYPNTPIAQEVIQTYNEAVILPAAARTGATVAPVHAAFAGNQPALIRGYSSGVAGVPGRDGIAYPVHPNIRGHQVIADAFAPFTR